MANRRLERVGIEPRLCERLMKGNISTVRELLHTSPIVLMLLADIGMKEVNELIAMVSEKTCPNPQNALITMHARLQKKRHLSCGVEKFDTALKGGLLVGSISEICGAPGAGKTQFCLSCTLQGVVAAQQSATSSGAPSGAQQGGVIYIDTELKFDPNRLIQMAMERYPEMYSSEFRTDAPHQIDRLLDQVKVKRPTTMRELQEELGLLQTSVISQNISLVVVDSIAALARKEGFNERDKEEFFISQASLLKKLAELCGCVVLATNQVSPTGSSNPSDLYGDAIHDEWGTYQPTLGPTWHHCVSTRLTMRMLQQSAGAGAMQPPQRGGSGGGGGSGAPDASQSALVPVRCLSITKSPVAPPFELHVMIAAKGVVEHVA